MTAPFWNLLQLYGYKLEVWHSDTQTVRIHRTGHAVPALHGRCDDTVDEWIVRICRQIHGRSGRTASEIIARGIELLRTDCL